MAREEIKYINAAGEEVNLNQEGVIEYLYGRAGAFAPAFQLVTRQRIDRDGEELRNVKAKGGETEIPVQVLGSNATELWDRLNDLRSKLNPKRGMGKLVVTAPNGRVSEVECICSEFNMKEDEGDTFLHETAQSIQKLLLVFYAPDPYWQDIDSITQVFTINPGTNSFFPLLPMRLSASEVIANQTITNNGDVEAYPLWTIVGPGTDPAIRNQTTGKFLKLKTSLGSGEFITIDTKNRRITKNNGENLYPNIEWGSELWTLDKGPNQIQVEMTNSDSGSAVQISYQERFLGV